MKPDGFPTCLKSEIIKMNSAYVIDILRTPIGKFGGTLATRRPDDMAALVIKALIERNPSVDVNLIEDVIFGAANQAGKITGTWLEWPCYSPDCQLRLVG